MLSFFLKKIKNLAAKLMIDNSQCDLYEKKSLTKKNSANFVKKFNLNSTQYFVVNPEIAASSLNGLVKKIFLLHVFTIFLFACSSNQNSQDLVNRIGFDSQSNPQVPPQSRTASDYYYRQSGQNAANPYGNYSSQTATPYQYQQPYPPQYYVAPPYVAAPYQVYPGGGSRLYSNPYAVPPPQYYPQYDSDQYYVPPMANSGVEPPSTFNNRY